MDVTKPYQLLGIRDIHGPKLYELIGLRWAFISQPPVVGLGLTIRLGQLALR